MSIEQDKSLWLVSLPRSGSNFISSEIDCMTRIPFLREPIRRSLGYTDESLSACDAGNFDNLNDLFQKIDDPIRRFRLMNVFQAIQENAHLIKETDGIFFLEPITASLPNLPIVYIHRPYGAVLASHLAIKDIYSNWNYDKRIRATRNSMFRILGKKEQISEYLGIYARAEDQTLEGSSQTSLMAAHLGIQALELQRLTPLLNLIPIEYEAVATDPEGELSKLLGNLGVTYQIRGRLPPSNYDSLYPHITKLSPEQVRDSINRWRTRFSPQEYDSLRLIFGESFDTLFPDMDNILPVSIAQTSNFKQKVEEKPVTENPENLPDFCYIDLNLEGRNIQVGNIPVSVEMMCVFLNEMVAGGIETPHQLLCMDISKKEIQIDSAGTYLLNPKSYHHPITHVSPIAAALFSLHCGAKMGTIAIYQQIHDLLDSDVHGNHAETFPTTMASGSYSPTKEGIFDLSGNVREICLDDGHAFTYGGSFSDEIHVAREGIINPFPISYSDRHIGFRLMTDPSEPNPPFNAVEWLHQIKEANYSEIEALFHQLISLSALSN